MCNEEKLQTNLPIPNSTNNHLTSKLIEQTIQSLRTYCVVQMLDRGPRNYVMTLVTFFGLKTDIRSKIRSYMHTYIYTTNVLINVDTFGVKLSTQLSKNRYYLSSIAQMQRNVFALTKLISICLLIRFSAFFQKIDF